MRPLDRPRVIGWVVLISVLSALGYASRSAGGKPPRDAAYLYSTAISGLLQYAIVLGIVLAITRPDWTLLALRRPRSYRAVAAGAIVVFITVYVAAYVVSSYSDPEGEQGLTPEGWDSHRVTPFVVNFIIFVAVAPAIEEITFRGLGYSVLQPLGRLQAILWVGIAFGLAHGLIEGLPVLIVFGAGLAYLRSRVDSVYPGIAVHATFNAIALIAAVTT